MTKTLSAAAVILVGLFMIVLLYLMAMIADTSGLGDQVSLPLLAISGIVLLISILALAAIAFALFEMNDRAQALGLPEGSVRAVIALSLVLLFGILSVYLYGSLASAGIPMREADLAPSKAISLLKALPDSGTTTVVTSDGEVLSRVDAFKAYADLASTAGAPVPPPTGTSTAASSQVGATAPQPTGTNGATPFQPEKVTWSVYYTAPHSEAADDFAKQLLVMIGTLVTSVASFYFGSKAAGATQQGAATQQVTPVLRKIDPDTAAISQKTVGISLEGDSLNQIVGVKIVLGDKSISAQQVVSNDGLIKCQLDVSQAVTGSWDIIATDASGKSVKLAGALKITP